MFLTVKVVISPKHYTLFLIGYVHIGRNQLKFRKHFIKISYLLMFILVGSANAQQNLAQEAYAIFERSCLRCHGENGSHREALIIQHTALIEGGTVIPGDPDGSELYQRLIETAVEKRMPLGQPPLDAEAIETIRQWIAASAPDWNAIPKPETDFITTDAMLGTIENHVKTLSTRDKTFARYFTLTHLYNAGETTEALHAYRRALSKLINSLSWGLEVVKPLPIDVEQTVFYIDIRKYEWDVRNDAWTQIEQVYPYQMAFDAPTQTHLRDKLTNLQQEMNCEVPFVHVDWFLANASLPPLYHDILALPETDRELEVELRVFVIANLQNAPGERVWRAGFNDSGVSRHNRVVERHTSSYGAYWKSYDFAGSTESQNIFAHPLDFTHDGGEIIFNLPNGLQAYYLVDAGGNRLDKAPISIVSNPAVGDPTVRNGLSCIGCHTEGMKTFEDEVRAVVEQADNPPFNKERALELYAEKSVMDELVKEDTQRYRDALEAAGGVFGGIEPIQRFHEAFQGTLSVAHAAAAVGLETETFLEKISKSTTLQNLLGALVLENGAIKRDAWTSDFHDVIAALNTPDSVLPPVVQRPEIIPGASVRIPDANLRAAIEDALGKAPGDVITVQDMATLTEFSAEGMGIQDITGLEYATNLGVLRIGGNSITDISPLARLTQMGHLRIEGNKISDISPLTKLKNIGNLEMYSNEIKDISPLAGLTKMRWLSVYANPVSDLSPLRNMQGLRGMRVTVVPPGDLSPLAELVNLTRIFYWSSGYPIADLSPLAKLPKLRFIEIGHAGGQTDLTPLAKATALEHFSYFGPTPDLSPLTNLSHLFKIEIWDGENPDLSPLARAIGLKELWVSRCGISDISFLENLTSLERLNLQGNNISDVSPLAGLTNLKWLKLTDNPITDFSPLAELAQTTNILTGEVAIPDLNLRAAIAGALGKDADDVFVPITTEEIETLTTLRASKRDIKDLTGIEQAINLEELWISGNPVSDLSPLAGLTNLIGLGAWETPITDLSPLKELTKLRWIDFGKVPLSDLSPLAGITSLKKLTFYNCEITDISPLEELTDLIFLEISNNSITDLSSIAALINLESLAVRHSRISDISPLAALTKLKKLDFRGNNISDVSPLTGLVNLEVLNLHGNSISDISPLEELSVFPVNTFWVDNPGSAISGPRIVGPWLWVNLPAEDLDTDWLAVASGNAVTEQQVATYGAVEGKLVGNNIWKAGKIDQDSDNINKVLDSFGYEGDRDYQVIYGTIVLNSPIEQEVMMLQGKSDGSSLKIWINGELAHEDIRSISFGHRYERFFHVTLKQGSNVLLVAVLHEDHSSWAARFGFEEGTEYTVIPHDVGIRFSTTETTLLVGDTFALNLNAENITDLAGWQTDIVFNPDVLEAVEVTEGDFLKSEGGGTFYQAGTIDNTAGKITGLFSARISESGVSGTGTLLSVTFKAKAGGETQVALQNFEFISITDDIIPTVPPNIIITVRDYPTWDVNQDGRVSIQDLVLVAKDLGSGTPTNLRTDVNRDGEINIQDLILVAQYMGESTDSAATPPIVAIDSKVLTPAIVQAWIKHAQVEDDGSIAFRQGIANLQKLLASLIPEKTALLANYPNPFNPETWIPYHLAKPSEVTLTIYAANGSVVRTLALGHQAAGIYQSRSRAAYWDGRNGVGESVASGIYFYTLTAGDFTATRKMLILK